MINLAVCDDDDDALASVRNMMRQYVVSHPQYEMKVTFFKSPLEMLSIIVAEGKFDVLLLDIYMSGMAGTDVARELRRMGDKAEIIFTTSSREHAIDAFAVDAAQYLVKPYKETELFAALDKVLKRLCSDRFEAIAIKTSIGIIRLMPRDVVFTETSRNNYQTIHTVHGKSMEVRMTSKELFQLLAPEKYFIKCGASFNLNLKYVRQIAKDFITLDTGEKIAIPYRSYAALKEQFLSLQMDNDL